MLLAFMPSVSLAAAPPGENITASPTQISVTLTPGSTTKGQATIINDGDKSYAFKTYVAPYRVSGEDYDQSFSRAAGASDPSDWIKVDIKPVTLAPRQSVVVPYSITVPAGTGGGGYYATLFYETLPRATAGSGVATTQRVGSVVYMRVEGEIIERGRIESFKAPFFQPGPPVAVELRMRNDGNVHYTAEIDELITDVFGHEKYRTKVVRKVLPQTTRRFDLAWQKAPAFGLFKVGGEVRYLNQRSTLPTRYVLVMSSLAFLLSFAGLLLVIGLLVRWFLALRQSKPKS